MTLFTEIFKNPKTYVESQRTQDSWSNSEQKEQCWMDYQTRFQGILQSYTNKYSMVPAQMEQWNKIEDPNTRTHNYSHLTANRSQKYKQEKRQYFQQMVKTGCLQEWIRPLPITLYSNQFWMDQSMQCKRNLKCWKLPEENLGSTLQDTGVGKDFLNWTQFTQELGQQLTNGTSPMKFKSFYIAKESSKE